MRTAIWILSAWMVTFTFYSCLDDDSNSVQDKANQQVVTVYPTGNGEFYLKTDLGNKLKPTNAGSIRLSKQQRAMVTLIVENQIVEDFDYAVQIMKIDTILTKPVAVNLGDQNDKVYGTDPVRMFGPWIGDGYLNLWFGTDWGGKTAHFVNVIQRDPENAPYELEFRHNAYDDPKEEYALSTVAFDLSSLPDTEGETVDLLVYFNQYGTEGVVKLKYNSTKSTLTDSPGSDADMLLSAEQIKGREYLD